MSKQGRILVVDNLAVWRDELVETLQRRGYYVDAASTIAEALQHLQESFYHILVADMRMKDTDQSNIDGLALLDELERGGLSEATRVIMLSAFGTPRHIREAFTTHRVADFLSKEDFSQEAFLQTIARVFARDVQINLALEILCPAGSQLKQAVVNLDIGGTRIRQGDPRQDLIAEELEDLLCRLFHETQRILVQVLPAGKSGAGVLRVQPFFPTQRVGQEVIVKFGDAHRIQEERRNFKEYVEPFIGGGRSTAIRGMRRTTHLGGIIYTFLGADSQELKDFAEFYHTASVPAVKRALDLLFRETCGIWYANRQLQLLDIRAEYQRMVSYPLTDLEQIRIRQFRSVRGRHRLTFTALNTQRKFINPLLVAEKATFARTTFLCTTHGDFNPQNLLVNNTGSIWLIDFQETGLSHILRDIAQLDAAVRFQLLTESAAALQQRFALEEMLLAGLKHFSEVEHLPDEIPAENQQELARAYATVVHLRRLAFRLLSTRSPQGEAPDDIGEYYIALFFAALQTLQFFSLAPVQREHALLSASLLAERLGLGSAA
jgi:CheY-like chemotaxis protein